MNDEIKEILDKLKNKDNDIKGINFLKYQDLTRGEIDLLLDYITNLEDTLIDKQECIDAYNEIINNRDKEITNLQQEIQEANDSITWWANRFKAVERENERLKQENERLKDIVVEKDNQIKEMILQKTDYTAVNILEMKLEDYKSRCEKAIEYINDILYPIGSCVNGSDLPYESIESLLNILQNGSDNNV